MNLDDLKTGLFAGATINIEAINIQTGDNAEMYTAPVQINQTGDTPAVGAGSVDDDRIPLWDTDPLVRDGDTFYHATCKRDIDLADRLARMQARYPIAWQVVAITPDTTPEPEPARLQLEEPQRTTIFEEIDERYSASYAELIANGVSYGRQQSAWLSSLNSGVSHD